MKSLRMKTMFSVLAAGLVVFLLGELHAGALAQEAGPQGHAAVTGGEATVTCSIEYGTGQNAVFKPYFQFNCARIAYDVAAGDLNHDGRSDVVLSTRPAAGPARELLVFLEGGNGALGQPVVYPAGNQSDYLAVGDFNHDGWDDVATADKADGTISIYLQQGDGTLAGRVTYAANTGPDGIAAGDVNGDTLDDIVVSHAGSAAIGVFTQKGDGTLNAVVPYPSVQAGVDAIAVGDVNGDGRKDVVKMNGQGTANPNLMVYLQNGTGTLDPAVSYRLADCPAEAPCTANKLAIGDVTGDGREDVILGYGQYSTSAKIAVFRQDETGALLPSVAYSSFSNPGAVGVVDLNSDARTDVVVEHGGWGRLGVYGQQGDGTLAAETIYDVAYGGVAVDTGDVNNDGHPDVLMANYLGLIVLYQRNWPIPTALSPAGSIVDRTPTYEWEAVPGGTEYRYQLMKGTALVYEETAASTVCDAGVCTSTPPTVLADGNYKWRVQVMHEGMWHEYSSYKLFGVDTAPVPQAPFRTIKDPTPIYTWSRVATATQYRYELRRGAALIYTKTVFAGSCGTTTCSHTPAPMLADGIYKWRVQAMVQDLWGAYSSYWEFTINTAPSTIAPSGQVSDPSPTYKWTTVPGASQYRLQLLKGATAVYTRLVAASTCGAMCANTPTVFIADYEYQWRVQAMIGGIWRPYGYGEFILHTIPFPISPSYIIRDTTPTYQWTSISGVSQYRIELRRAGALFYTKTAPASVCGTSSTCVYTPTTVIRSESSYTWRVQALAGGQWRPYSVSKPFEIPALPKPGFWKGVRAEFYVTSDQNHVHNFAIYVTVSGCGTYKVTHAAEEPIDNNTFRFSGPFYASGGFSSVTKAWGTAGLRNFYIAGCGYVSGGPWQYSVVWTSPGQPLVETVAPGQGVDVAALLGQALRGYKAIKLEAPAR